MTLLSRLQDAPDHVQKILIENNLHDVRLIADGHFVCADKRMARRIGWALLFCGLVPAGTVLLFGFGWKRTAIIAAKEGI